MSPGNSSTSAIRCFVDATTGISRARQAKRAAALCGEAIFRFGTTCTLSAIRCRSRTSRGFTRRCPTTGGGKMVLDIRSEKNPHILDYILTNMDVRTTGSRLLGKMTFATGDPVLIVKNLDLQAAPVDFDLLRTLNGKPFPYDWQGKLTGTIKAPGGPLNHFLVGESSLTFADAHVPGAITRASGEGELDILFPAFTAFHDFHVDVATLDLRTLQYLNPLFPRIKGTISVPPISTRRGSMCASATRISCITMGRSRCRTLRGMDASRGASISSTIWRFRRSHCRSRRSPIRTPCFHCVEATRARCRSRGRRRTSVNSTLTGPAGTFALTRSGGC